MRVNSSAFDKVGFSPSPSISRSDLPARVDLGEGYRFYPQRGELVHKDHFWSQELPCTGDEELLVLGDKLREGRLRPEWLAGLEVKSPKARAVLEGEVVAEELSGTDLSRFQELCQALKGVGRKRRGHVFFAVTALERLARDGTLTKAKDAAGKSLLDNIWALYKDDSLLPRLKEDLLVWSLLYAAFPKRAFEQAPGKGTCAATSIAYLGWEEDPAEMVRLVRELAVEGKVRLRSGGVMERPKVYLANEGGCSTVEELLQASFMDYADPDYKYDFSQDAFVSQAPGNTKGKPRERGLFPEHQLRLLEGVTGRSYQVVKPPQAGAEFLEKYFQAQGERAVAQLDWSSSAELHSRHLLVVTKVDDSYVYLKDPLGSWSQQVGKGHECFDYGFEKLTRQEFERRLNHLIVAS